MSGLLLDTPLSTEQRELTDTVRVCAAQLLELVNDVLDFTKRASCPLRPLLLSGR
jgi:signal transduction histidine kinase